MKRLKMLFALFAIAACSNSVEKSGTNPDSSNIITDSSALMHDDTTRTIGAVPYKQR
jgi:hypothetical protein